VVQGRNVREAAARLKIGKTARCDALCGAGQEPPAMLNVVNLVLGSDLAKKKKLDAITAIKSSFCVPR